MLARSRIKSNPIALTPGIFADIAKDENTMATAPGWYDDGSGTQRWWDGTQWTAHQAPAQASAPQYPQAPAQQVAQYPQGYAASQNLSNYAPKGPRNKGLLVVAGIVGGVVIVTGIVLAVVLAGGVGSSPEATVKSHVAAFSRGDCEAAVELTSDYYQEYTGTGAEDYCDDPDVQDLYNEDETLSVTEIESEVDGDTARVEFVVEKVNSETGDTEVFDTVAELIKVDGHWLIDTLETN